MTRIVETVATQDEDIEKAVASYIDDLFVATDVVVCEK